MADFVRAGILTDLAEGQGLCAVVDGVTVALFLVDGAVHALEDRCSHAEGFLSGGRVEGGSVECPVHGARFDIRTGAALSLPAVVGVRTFPVRVEGEEILVRVR